MLTTALLAIDAVKLAVTVTVPPGASEMGVTWALSVKDGATAAVVVSEKLAAESVHE
jgi:hypothetical protein